MTNEQKGFTLEDFTGFEIIEFEKVLGVPMSKADEKGALVAYAIAYIAKRRDDKSLKWDDVLALSFKEVSEFIGDDEDEVSLPFEEAPKD